MPSDTDNIILTIPRAHKELIADAIDKLRSSLIESIPHVKLQEQRYNEDSKRSDAMREAAMVLKELYLQLITK